MLTNALKYGFPDALAGEVRLVVQATSDGIVRLTLSDTGRGLPPDFETRRAASLGLQLVSDLTRQLGGRLDIEAVPATFAVSFTVEAGRPTFA